MTRQVMEGAALVVAAIPSGPPRSGSLNAVFSPVVTPMHAMLRASPQPQDDQQKHAILTLSDRLGVLFRSCLCFTSHSLVPLPFTWLRLGTSHAAVCLGG